MIEGNSVAVESSNLSTSTGDEPGTAGGIISSKNKGKLTWQTKSLDVMFEGKGVVRFGEVTLHNGNTFNTAFIQNGGTGYAYGDDARNCPICGKGPKQHRVHETEQTAAMAMDVIRKLGVAYEQQKPEIMRFLDAWVEEERERATLRENAAAMEQATQETERNRRKRQCAASERRIASLRQIRAEANAKIASMQPVLKLNKLRQLPGTYYRGYMVGALVCRCAKHKLAAVSGLPPDGVPTWVERAGFKLCTPLDPRPVGVSAPQSWQCAAPKLLSSAGAAGHRVKSLSEKWFSPVVHAAVRGTVSIPRYKRNGRFVSEKFAHGETVPSCDTCQRFVPAFLCNNNRPCP